MKIIFTGTRFQVSDYTKSEQEKLKQLGFHYDFKAWAYWTGLLHLAQEVSKLPGVKVDPKATERLNQEDDQIALSRAIDSNAIIPVPDGLQYLKFQKGGIMYALPRKDTLLADVMRLGKTVQAIGVINADPSINNVLCICPNFLKLNWSREFMKWTVRKLTGSIALTKSAMVGNKYKTVYILEDTNIVIMNYDIVKKFRPAINQRKWDLVIFDEAHYLKNPSSRRTKACLGADFYGEETEAPIEATRRLYLTGTPILNRPVELWPILRVADPEGLGTDFWSFCKTFCNAWEASYGWDTSGASNLDELQRRLRAKLMVRRTKEEVLPELPPIRRQIIPIPAEAKDKKVILAEKEFYDKNMAAFEAAAVQAKIAQAEGSETTYQAAIDEMKAVNKVMFHQMSKLRHDTAVAKIPYVIEYLENTLESQEKVVCFAHHRDVIEAIANHFGERAVKHYGSPMTVTEKQASVDRFKDDPKCNLFVGGYTLAVGYSLAIASLVIFAEISWVPGDLDQAEKRLDAIDQMNSILVQHLLFDESLDISQAQRIIEKQSNIFNALDKKLVG